MVYSEKKKQQRTACLGVAGGADGNQQAGLETSHPRQVWRPTPNSTTARDGEMFSAPLVSPLTAQELQPAQYLKRCDKVVSLPLVLTLSQTWQLLATMIIFSSASFEGEKPTPPPKKKKQAKETHEEYTSHTKINQYALKEALV